MRITVLGKSPSWQDAGGACSGYLVEEDGTTRCCSTAATGSSRKLRACVDYVDVDAVVISHLHADHFLDLVPYSLRADLRAAPAAGARSTAGRAPTSPARPRLLRARAARARPSAASSGRGATRTSSRTPSTSREYAPATTLEVGPLRLRFHEVPALPADATRSSCARATAAGASSTAPTARPTDELVDFARGTDLLHDRGDAAAPRARRAARPPDARARRASTRARARRAAARAHPHLRRARRRCGRATRRERGVRRRRSRSPARARSTTSSAVAASTLVGHAARARPLRQLRAHAPRDGRAVRRRLRAHRARAAARPGSRPRSTSSTSRGDPPRAVVHAELAGIDPDELGLEIHGRELIIAGHRRPGRGRGPRLPAARDRASGPFRRVIPLGADVVVRRRPRATYQDGILRVELPLAQPARPRGAACRSRCPRAATRPARDRVARRAGRPSGVVDVGGPRGAAARALPVLPLRETVAVPRHADAAGHRPGALRRASSTTRWPATACS